MITKKTEIGFQVSDGGPIEGVRVLRWTKKKVTVEGRDGPRQVPRIDPNGLVHYFDNYEDAAKCQLQWYLTIAASYDFKHRGWNTELERACHNVGSRVYYLKGQRMIALGEQ